MPVNNIIVHNGEFPNCSTVELARNPEKKAGWTNIGIGHPFPGHVFVEDFNVISPGANDLGIPLDFEIEVQVAHYSVYGMDLDDQPYTEDEPPVVGDNEQEIPTVWRRVGVAYVVAGPNQKVELLVSKKHQDPTTELLPNVTSDLYLRNAVRAMGGTMGGSFQKYYCRFRFRQAAVPSQGGWSPWSDMYVRQMDNDAIIADQQLPEDGDAGGGNGGGGIGF